MVKKETWAQSEAKSTLRAGLLNGEITQAMSNKDIFNLHPNIHQKWCASAKDYRNWCSNLRNLRNAIGRDKARLVADLESYGHDIAIVKASREANDRVPWHRTECPKLLKQDVDNGRHKILKPKLLHLSREAYKAFSLEEFRKHIYQEVDSRPKRAIRFEKKKKAWKYPELHSNHPRLRES